MRRAGATLGAVRRFLGVVASPVAEHRLEGMRASAVVAHGFSRVVPRLWSTSSVAHGVSFSSARGIFLDQGSNPVLLC